MNADVPVKNPFKVYVEVNVKFYPDGRVTPLTIIWRDGKIFNIDKVTDVRRAAARRGGGVGIRYTCVIEGHNSFLFYEGNNLWFVEERAVDISNSDGYTYRGE